jgi:hypothetical protein
LSYVNVLITHTHANKRHELCLPKQKINSLCDVLQDELLKHDNGQDTEIVVLSDTVRQRRTRTSENYDRSNEEATINSSEKTFQASVLPDLLPTTFRLAESSNLFFKVSKNTLKLEIDRDIQEKYRQKNNVNPEFSIVEIREKNLSTKMSIHNMDVIKDETNIGQPENTVDSDVVKNDPKISVVAIREGNLNPKMSILNLEALENEIAVTKMDVEQVVDTITMESCEAFEPEYVETVNIVVDVSSDTDTTCSIEKLDNKFNSNDSIETELENELQKVIDFETSLIGEENGSNNDPKMLKIEKHHISFDETKLRKGNERDILKDSEYTMKMKLRPSLKELLTEERNSFYSSDKETYDELPAFSEDEDIPRFSIELATDSDSDTVVNFIAVFLLSAEWFYFSN